MDTLCIFKLYLYYQTKLFIFTHILQQAQQSGNEPSEEEEPPREDQNMAPGQERGSGGQPEAQGDGRAIKMPVG